MSKFNHNPQRERWTMYEWNTNVRAYRSTCLCSIVCRMEKYRTSPLGKVYHSREMIEAALGEVKA